MKAQMINNTIKRLVYSNYKSAKAYHVVKLYYYNLLHSLNSKNRETIVVYQMGKVGSSTVVKSLQALKNMNVYHIHGLTQFNIERTENICKQNFPRMRRVHNHILESQYLKRQLDKGLKSKNKWKIVTLVREPIARNISSFFEVLEMVLGYDYKNKIKQLKIESIVEELTELFIEKHIEYENEKSLEWFDTELKPALNIDVYAQEFPKSKGYEIYDFEHAELLLLRLENLSECAGDAFKNFLGIDGFQLVKDNIGSQKGYDTIYQGFLDSIVLPGSYVDKMYSSKYMRHFYSESEIEALKVKWSSKAIVGSSRSLVVPNSKD